MKRPFKYDPANNTDIRRRFEAIRKQRAENRNVTQLPKGKKA